MNTDAAGLHTPCSKQTGRQSVSFVGALKGDIKDEDIIVVVMRQVEIQVGIIINIVVAHIHGGRGRHHHGRGTFCEMIKTRI
jgi:hypothetical protein